MQQWLLDQSKYEGRPDSMNHFAFGYILGGQSNLGHGTAAISGTTQAGATLTCSYNMDDPDGGETSIGYQWYQDSTPLIGATSPTYLVQPTDVGHALKCRVDYTDARGNSESVFTQPSSSVVAATLAGTFRGQFDLASSAANPIQQLGVNIGLPQADRYVAVVWYAASLSAQVGSMTIGGVAATLLASVSLTGIHSGIFLAQVPAGATADIVATYSGSPNNIASFAVYTITGSGGLGLLVLDTAQLFNSSGGLTKNFSTATNGFLIGHIGYSAAANQTITTSMTQDGTRVSSSNRSWYGHSAPAASSVSLTLASFSGNKSLLGVSFGV